MSTPSMRSIFTAAVVAGLAAALLVAGFHFMVTEPIIEQAIAIEDAAREMEGIHDTPVISREIQGRVGLFVGFLIYGVSWALLFGAAYTLSHRVLPGASAARRGMVLAALAYWAVCLVPFLRYPANPPGVGEPATIQYRQDLYIAVLCLSVVSTIASVAIARYLGRGRPTGILAAVTLGLLIAFAGGMYLMLPPNPDPIRLPLDLVFGFRLHSLAGLTLFWVILGAGFAWLVSRPPHGRPSITGSSGP